jgi:uncharacterized protein YndB with AHSA1/START domain
VSSDDPQGVHRTIDVAVPVERAWAVFTGEMGEWWPLATHSISAEGDVVPDGLVVEGRVGGEIYETIGDDRRLWGTIAEWEPPRVLGVDWTVGGDVTTRWTATFSAIPTGTRVALDHVGFGAHGEREATVRDGYGSEGGWTLVLDAFERCADSAARAVE